MCYVHALTGCLYFTKKYSAKRVTADILLLFSILLYYNSTQNLIVLSTIQNICRNNPMLQEPYSLMTYMHNLKT